MATRGAVPAVTEGTAVVWMVRVAMAMHWAEVRAMQKAAVRVR